MIIGAMTDPELDIYRQHLRRFVDAEIIPQAAAIDETDSFPSELFGKLASLGLFGIPIPPDHGGSGLSYRHSVLAMEEIARGSASLALSFGAHAFLCALNLYRFGSPSQRQAYLPPLLSGEKIGAFALTEPAAGSDALSLTTRAEPSGARFLLSGSKTFITNGPVANLFLLFARSAKGISAFVVEREFGGMTTGSPMKKMGMRGSPTSEVVLEDCPVPRENLLGEEGEGERILLAALDTERVVLSGIPLGIAGYALEQAVAYAKSRQQFGRPIGGFQLIQAMLAGMATELDVAKLLTNRAANLLDQGRDARLEASMAKLFAGEMVMRATTDAVQIFGGYGYIREFPMERLMRDAKLISIGGGTSQIQKVIIAKTLLGG